MTSLQPDMMPFSRLLGLEMVSSEKDRIVAEFRVTESLCTTGRIMHGGAIMSVADTLGAIGAFLNLPEGHKTTTTIESKTNWPFARDIALTRRGPILQKKRMS